MSRDPYRVAPPPNQSVFTEGEDNNVPTSTWKNWFNQMHSVLDRRGLMDSPDGSYAYMHYTGDYTPRAHKKNEVVVSQGWTMCCINDTNDPPHPITDGPEETSPGTGVGMTNANTLGEVQTWHQYDFTTGGWARRLEYYIPEVGESISYNIVAINNTDPNDPKLVYNTPIFPEAVGWYLSSVTNLITPANSSYIFGLIANNRGESDSWQASWSRGGDDNNNGPGVGQWNRNTQNSTVRFNHTDLDAIGRQGQLEGITAGSDVRITNSTEPDQWVEYRINTITANADHVAYGVTQMDSGLLGEPPTGTNTYCRFTTYALQTTQYGENVGYWSGNQPTFATVSASLTIGGTTTPTNDAYGIRFTFQPGTMSPDWGFVAYSDI